MIISRKNKYLFIQLPHTGCTAVARELREFYAGEPIHRKHSFYHQFQRNASDVEKEYFTFSAIRNPIDEVVSIYYKLKTNHEGYDNPRNFTENGGFVSPRVRGMYRFVQSTKGGFAGFFTTYFRVPYDNWSRLDHRRFGFVMRFESLGTDFGEVLRRLGLTQDRALPLRNKTRRSGLSSFDHFDDKMRKKACWVFGPFMEDWGYRFPEDWGARRVPWEAYLLYQCLGVIRTWYWRRK